MTANIGSQFAPQKPVTLKLRIGDEEITEEGRMFSEATFISAIEETK